MSRWFRHYAGMMRDDKLVRVAIRSGQTIERVAWVWGAILESAAEIDDGGRFDFDPDEAAWFLRADASDLARIVEALAASGRIAEDYVVKWGNRQFASDRSKDRVAAHRERKRSEKGGSNDGSAQGNADVTLQKRHRIAPETETETETEETEAKASSARPWVLPTGVSLATWTDFLTNRKRKRLVNTPSTWKTFQDDLARVSAQTGIPPPQLIEECTGKGWGGIYDPRERNDGQQRTDSMGRHQPGDGLSPTTRAARAVFGVGTSH